MPRDGARRYPIGAELIEGGGAHVRVWAPSRRRVVTISEPDRTHRTALEPERDGYFSALVPWLGPGTRYAFQLDDDERLYPDPASRFQPEGPHGPSEMVDPAAFAWSDRDWKGVAPRGQVLYELHLGTFTPEGTYAAAIDKLQHLRDVGVTVIELMPVADFPGRFGWGYDGVNLWAPSRLYGRPDDLRRFVDTAHRLGLGVILDVVYNHLGPDGNYLTAFSPRYFTDRYKNEWGDPLNFDGPDAAPVREYFVENAGYWIAEYHFDGLRLDATQQIFDASPEHLVSELARRARAAATDREIYLIAENEPQETKFLRPASGSGASPRAAIDANWNDDFHHVARVVLTGRNEAYYTDYRGTAQELLSALRWGYLYQGQRYKWQQQRRGTPALDLPATSFVHFLENHDQVANSARGARLPKLTSPGKLRALTAVLLLGPETPLLFQGQEFGSTRCFAFFADHGGTLGKQVTAGRSQFLHQFPSLAAPDMQAVVPDPVAEETFARSKLDWGDRDRNREALALHRDLLRLRRTDPAFAAQNKECLHGSVLAPDAFAIRFACPAGDRLLLVNLGRDLHLDVAPEPLLAPPAGRRWRLLWSSEAPEYGGTGTPPVEDDAGFHLPGQSAVVLEPGEDDVS